MTHGRRVPAPLRGIQVVEFTHMVMGPAVGAILVELGADVIKVEPVGGDATRELLGSGAGYFSMYNRNKKSICLDLKDPRGLDAGASGSRPRPTWSSRISAPGTMDKLGPRLRGAGRRRIRGSSTARRRAFSRGPYEHRTALDEVAQMMGGLAYMTGPPGRPLRAGSVGHRRDRRHVRRDRHPRGARGAAPDRARPEGRELAVRDDGLPRRPAHGAEGGHRPGGEADAGAHLGLGDLRRVRDAGRRAGLRRHRVGLAVAEVLRGVRASASSAPTRATRPTRSASRARETLLPQVRALFKTYHQGRPRRQARDAPGCPSRRSASPRTCSTTRTCSRAAGSATSRSRTARRRSCRCCRSSSTAHRPTQGGHLPRAGQHTREVLEALGLDGEQIDSLAASSRHPVTYAAARTGPGGSACRRSRPG